MTQSEGTPLYNVQGLWDDIILLCSNLFYKLERVKLRVEHPPQSKWLMSPQILPSPFHSFISILLAPFHLAFFPSLASTHPSSRQPSSSDRGQRSSLHDLLQDTSPLKIQQPFIHTVTKVDGVNSRRG